MMKKKVFWGILIFIGLLMAYDFTRNWLDDECIKVKNCGTVIHKSEELRQAKNATHHNMYVTVRCADDTYHDVDVSTHTYLTVEKGDTVCFEISVFNFWIVYRFLCAACFICTILTSIALFFWGCSLLYDKYIDN